MGMYTETYVNVDLKEQTPSDVISALKAICGGDFDNPLLATFPPRWSLLFGNGSYYTPLTCVGKLTFDEIRGAWSLIGKGDIKNYGGEIEQFFEWIDPWVDAKEGEFIGYHRHEENLLPTLVTKKPEPTT